MSPRTPHDSNGPTSTIDVPVRVGCTESPSTGVADRFPSRTSNPPFATLAFL